MKTLKLVGARTFGSPAAGLTDPMAKGDKKSFGDDIAAKLLALTWLDKAGNTQPIFVDETVEEVVDAVENEGAETKPLEQAIKDGDFTDKAPAKKAAPKKAARTRTTGK